MNYSFRFFEDFFFGSDFRFLGGFFVNLTGEEVEGRGAGSEEVEGRGAGAEAVGTTTNVGVPPLSGASPTML